MACDEVATTLTAPTHSRRLHLWLSSQRVGDASAVGALKPFGFIALRATGSCGYIDLTVTEDRATLGSDPSAVTVAIRHGRAAGKFLRPPALPVPEALKR